MHDLFIILEKDHIFYDIFFPMPNLVFVWAVGVININVLVAYGGKDILCTILWYSITQWSRYWEVKIAYMTTFYHGKKMYDGISKGT